MYNLTDEENDLVYEFAILELLQRVFEHERKIIENSGLKFKDALLEVIDQATFRSQKDLRDLRVKLNHAKIKLHKNANLHYLVVYRGYENDVKYHANTAKEKCEEKYRMYLKEGLKNG